VVAGAAGVTGGASQLVLESQYAAQAREDLATVDQNSARAQGGIAMSRQNTLNHIDGERIDPFSSGIVGVAQGIGTFTRLSDGLNSIVPRSTPAPPAPEVPFAGTNANPTIDQANPNGVFV
jgi:hypothetical protein